MGVALLLDERELAHPLIGLAQGDAVLLGEADEPLARPVQKLRIRRMGHVLRLHGRVHHGRREVGWLQRSGLRRNRKALLDQRVEPLLAHALPPARQRRAVEGKRVLEELLAAKVLEIRVLQPGFAQPLVRQVLAVLQDAKPRHQSRWQGRAAGTVRIDGAELLFEKSPIDPLRQPHARMAHVYDLVEPRLEQIVLARLLPLPWLHPRPRMRISVACGGECRPILQENRPRRPEILRIHDQKIAEDPAISVGYG